MWQESESRIIFQCKVAERDAIVLSNAVIELFPESDSTGKESEQPTTAPPQSQLIFEQIDQRIAEHPEWIRQIRAVYQFNITGDHGGQYVVDLKNDGGSARSGEDPNRMQVAR